MQVTLIGLKFRAVLVGLSALGIADKIAKNNSEFLSPVSTQSYKSLHTSLDKIGFAKRILRVATSNPKQPGEA
jgi:hypothetical protein